MPFLGIGGTEIIKYNRKTHSFTYDDESSDEMPSINDIKKDKYGSILLRMLPFYKKNLIFRALKFNGIVHFSITSSDGHYTSAKSLKEMFDIFVSDEYVDYLIYSPFANMTYDEVLVQLDLLEAMKGKAYD